MNDTKKVLGKVGTIGDSLKRATLGEAKATAKSIGQQVIGIEQKPEISGNASKEAHAEKPIEKNDHPKQDNDDFVKALYGQSSSEEPSEDQVKLTERFTKENPDKSPEEIQKMISLYMQQHQQYYQNTFEKPQEQEERQAEKVEREKHEEKMEELKTEKKKPQGSAIPGAGFEASAESKIGAKRIG